MPLSVPTKFGNPFRHETQSFEEEKKRKRWKSRGRKTKDVKKDKKEKGGGKQDNKLIIITAMNKQRRPCFHRNHQTSYTAGTRIIFFLSLVFSVLVVRVLTVHNTEKTWNVCSSFARYTALLEALALVVC